MVCYPSLGGSGVVASQVAAGLARRGHEVHLLASATPAWPLPSHPRLHFHPVAIPAAPPFDQGLYEWGLSAAILATARHAQLDLVHLHFAVPHAACAFLARSVLGVAGPRFVLSLHGTDVTDHGAVPLHRDLLRPLLLGLDGLVVPSRFLRDAARDLLDLPPATAIEVIPNFVDTEHFRPAPVPDRRYFDRFFPAHGDEAGPVLVHVSNLRPIKRAADLIDVVARLRQDLPARLVVVGDGPERDLVAARAQRLGVADAVCFLGTRPELAELLPHADVFVLPSRSESFGVAALEALSCGVPVCAYRVGGLPEVVGAECGDLVPPFDVDALAAAVRTLVTDPVLHARQRRAARRHVVHHYPQEEAMQRYEAYYDRLLERR